MTEEKKKFGWGKGCLVVVGVLFGIGLIGAIFGDGKSGDTSGTPSQLASGSPADEGKSEKTASADAPAVEDTAIKVTAVQLERAYANNEAAAQKAYADGPLLVSGTISGIKLDFLDRPYVVLEGDDAFTGTQVKLVKEAQDAAASMEPGQKLTVLCESVSEVVGSPMLKDCSIPTKP